MTIPEDMIEGTEHKTNRFGSVIVVEYKGSKEVRVKFIETGYEVITQSSNIRSGEVKDRLSPTVCGIGCIGDGHYSSGSKGKHSDAYQVWVGMIYRCYNEEFHKLQPTYSDCYVCDEWLNFQSFAKWYEENLPDKINSYELDKDTIVKGNKCYSPETCAFISKAENIAFSNSKSYLFLTPKSKVRLLVRNLNQFCKKLKLNHSHMSKVARGDVKSCHGWTSSRGN